MILKKPYAFLIKHFKLIHLVFLGFLVFITYNFDKIVDFFSRYIKNNTIAGEKIAHTIIPYSIFIAIFIVILFSALMWKLMNNKRKPSKFYLLSGLYYFILFIATIYAYNIINELSLTTLTQQTSRAYHDIYIILFVPNFYFIIHSFIRGIGFDVKKFNFNKDLEELEIKREDNEEFEFVLGNDSYKYKRKGRRILRELKYYIVENKIFIGIILGALVIVGGIFTFLNVTFINPIYKVGDTLKTNEFTYKLNKAYISSTDYTGKQIKTDKHYLILDFSVKSNYKQTAIKSENFYLKSGKNVINYKGTLSDSFSDLGISYKGDRIGTDYENYIFVFELDNSIKDRSYELVIFDKTTYKNNKSVNVYQKYTIKPSKLMNNITEKNINLNDKITFNKELYGDTTLVIKSIKIEATHEYTYQECSNNLCTTSTNILFPSDSNRNNLISIEYELNIDKNITMSETYFFSTFVKVIYTLNNSTYKTNLSFKKVDSLDNYIYADIPKHVNNGDTINLVVSTRTEKNIIKIK